MDVTVRGPDTVARLARIDVLPPSDRPPHEQLAEDDAAWEAWREARRSGGPIGPCPRPAGPVRLYGGWAQDLAWRLLSRLPREA